MDRRKKHRIESSLMENLFRGPMLHRELKEEKKISAFRIYHWLNMNFSEKEKKM